MMYKWAINSCFPVLAIYKNKLAVVSMLASYSTTMLGFLAALIGLLLIITDSSIFKNYRRKGYLSIFFILYGTSILTLIAISLLTIINYGNTNTSIFLKIALVLFVDSLFQIAYITLIIINLIRKAISPM